MFPKLVMLRPLPITIIVEISWKNNLIYGGMSIKSSNKPISRTIKDDKIITLNNKRSKY